MIKSLSIISSNPNPTYSYSSKKLYKNKVDYQNKKLIFLSVISGELQ